jgi:hypothetical protein
MKELRTALLGVSVTAVIALGLTGCQQSPPPSTTVVREEPSTTERSTTATETKEVKPDPTSDPSNPTVVESTTKTQTTAEKKQ